MTNTTQNIIEKLDKQIRLSLVTAWELGKRQKLTPTKYNLDTDKLGQPIYDIVQTAITTARGGVVEEIKERLLIPLKWSSLDLDKPTFIVTHPHKVNTDPMTGDIKEADTSEMGINTTWGIYLDDLLSTLKGNHD